MNKKLLVLPLLLVAGVVLTSVLTTGTNVMVQSVYRDSSSLKLQTEEISEKIEESSSLLSITSQISQEGFVSARTIAVSGGATTALSMK